MHICLFVLYAICSTTIQPVSQSVHIYTHRQTHTHIYLAGQAQQTGTDQARLSIIYSIG